MTVVDGSGLLKAFLRDEGNGPHTIDLSRRKAYTALRFASRFPTSLAFAAARGSTLGSPMPNVEGTVGVSGAVGGDKDEVCANAGIAKVAHLLK